MNADPFLLSPCELPVRVPVCPLKRTLGASLSTCLYGALENRLLKPLITRLLVLASVYLGLIISKGPGGCRLCWDFLFGYSWGPLYEFNKSRRVHPLPVWMPPAHPLPYQGTSQNVLCRTGSVTRSSASSQKSHKHRGQ